MKNFRRAMELLAQLFGKRIETDDGEMVLAKLYKWRGEVYTVDTRGTFNPPAVERIKRAVEPLIHKSCPDCGGVGKLTWFTGFSDELGWVKEKRPCEKCNGTGHVLFIAPKLRHVLELLACFLGSLVVYAFLGWQETASEQCAVVLLLIMIDMAILRQATEGK